MTQIVDMARDRICADLHGTRAARKAAVARDGDLYANSYHAMIEAAELRRSLIELTIITQLRLVAYWEAKIEGLVDAVRTSPVNPARSAPDHESLLEGAHCAMQAARRRLGMARAERAQAFPDIDAQLQHWRALLSDRQALVAADSPVMAQVV